MLPWQHRPKHIFYHKRLSFQPANLRLIMLIELLMTKFFASYTFSKICLFDLVLNGKRVFFLKRSVHGNLKTAIARLILDRLRSNLLCIFFIPRLSFFVLWLYQNHRYFTVYPKKTWKFDLALAKMTSLQKKRSYDFLIFSQKSIPW